MVKVLSDVKKILDEKKNCQVVSAKVGRVVENLKRQKQNCDVVRIDGKNVSDYLFSASDPKIIPLTKSPQQDANNRKKKNNEILNELKGQYGFESVRAGMQSYSPDSKKNMERDLVKADLESKIQEKEQQALEVFAGKEHFAFTVKEKDVPVEKLLLKSDKKLWTKALSGTLSNNEKVLLKAEHNECHIHLQMHVEGINKKFLDSLDRPITKEGVLRAAYNAGGSALVMKLLQDKTFTKGEAQKFFEAVVEVVVPRNAINEEMMADSKTNLVLLYRAMQGDKGVAGRKCSTIQEVVRAYNEAVLKAKDEDCELRKAAVEKIPQQEQELMRKGRYVLTPSHLDEKIQTVQQECHERLSAIQGEIKKELQLDTINQKRFDLAVKPYKKKLYEQDASASMIKAVVAEYQRLNASASVSGLMEQLEEEMQGGGGLMSSALRMKIIKRIHLSAF